MSFNLTSPSTLNPIQSTLNPISIILLVYESRLELVQFTANVKKTLNWIKVAEKFLFSKVMDCVLIQEKSHLMTANHPKPSHPHLIILSDSGCLSVVEIDLERLDRKGIINSVYFNASSNA